MYRGAAPQNGSSGSAPLVTLFERDDAIAVPLLSQLRMAGYDVRASRTPVELFDTLSKSLVALVMVDLGSASAGRREFWVALDAQRRGRAIQVMTFRVISPHGDLDLDGEPSARAIADIEARGVHEFQRIIDGVRQRVPLHGAPAAPGFAQPGFAQPGFAQPGFAPVAGAGYLPNYAPAGAIQPLGAALGMAPTPFAAQNAHVFNAPAAAPAGWGGIAPLGVSPLDQQPGGYALGQPQGNYNGYGQLGAMGSAPFDPRNQPYSVPLSSANGGAGSSPFANPTPSNPFGPNSSPFAQPYQSNPFGGQSSPLPSSQPFSSQPQSPAWQPPSTAPSPSWNSSPVSPLGPSGQAQGAPSSFPPGNYPHGMPPSYPPSAPSSVPPWGSSRIVASPTSFDSDPHYPNHGDYGALPPFETPSAPAFQDAWSPPTNDPLSDDTPTGVVPEAVFQKHPIPQQSSPSTNFAASAGDWETRHEPISPTPAREPDYIPPRSQFAANPADRPERALAVTTPTETALGGVLVDGALLTPGKLETLKGIQAMLAGVNVHRKLGDLALLFKFLSSDQLLAALLVSRGLVSPQQIASLGRVKQELAASGVENDLESLLVSFHILPAEKLRQIRAELAG
jgi:hypothetical protein